MTEKKMGRGTEMYCSKCGTLLADNLTVCPQCGADCTSPVVEVHSKSMVDLNVDADVRSDDAAEVEDVAGRREKYAGTVRKCPHCGETLGAFQAYCPSCGYELNDSDVPDSVAAFSKQLQDVAGSTPDMPEGTNIAAQESLIKGFVVPSNKADLFDFMLLAKSNIESELRDLRPGERALSHPLIEAWYTKAGQVLNKGELVLREEDYSKLVSEYKDVTNRIRMHSQGKSAIRLLGLVFAVIACAAAVVAEGMGDGSSLFDLLGMILIIVGTVVAADRGRDLQGIIASAIGIATVFVMSKIIDMVDGNSSALALGSFIAAIVLIVSFVRFITGKTGARSKA